MKKSVFVLVLACLMVFAFAAFAADQEAAVLKEVRDHAGNYLRWYDVDGDGGCDLAVIFDEFEQPVVMGTCEWGDEVYRLYMENTRKQGCNDGRT